MLRLNLKLIMRQITIANDRPICYLELGHWNLKFNNSLRIKAEKYPLVQS
jgi:hypothetical protein